MEFRPVARAIHTGTKISIDYETSVACGYDDLPVTGSARYVRHDGEEQYAHSGMDRNYLFGPGDVLYICTPGALFLRVD